jgi:hypothetical protein
MYRQKPILLVHFAFVPAKSYLLPDGLIWSAFLARAKAVGPAGDARKEYGSLPNSDVPADSASATKNGPSAVNV